MAKSKAKTRTKLKSKSHLINAKILLVQTVCAKAKVKAKAKPKYKSGTKPKFRVRSGSVEKPRRRDVGDSKAQLQIEVKTEQEERNFGRCRVCRKENEHFSSACPYWNGVPPGAIVGEGNGVVFCGLLDRRLYKKPNRCAHPGGSSKGRLIVAYCNYCRDKGLHWSKSARNVPRTNHINLYSSHPLSRSC
ncbi:hypothetical protein D8674_041227 [Pyrus ussuriensis x Pyrus communis]|uniref:Uncharacterized protein n=1 Tax=Pyrus ussuriensis x Pyrus communis TaxID=2448454 RepID=A0A5N5H2Y7_9ROSA|nr:hypothetical protein D8674_041227 [Pyrus ussuriensis x Pyrus communis]